MSVGAEIVIPLLILWVVFQFWCAWKASDPHDE